MVGQTCKQRSMPKSTPKKSWEPKNGAGSSEIRLSEVWVDLAIMSTCCSVIALDTMLELITLFCQAWRDEAAETGAGASIEGAEQFITRCAMSFTTIYNFPRFCSLLKFHSPIRAYLVYLWVQDHISGFHSRIYAAFQEEDEDLHWGFQNITICCPFHDHDLLLYFFLSDRMSI